MKKTLIIPPILMLAALVFFAFDTAGIGLTLRNFTFDLFQRVSLADAPQDSNVILIDVDEPSLSQIGQWPWSRIDVARIVMKAANQGARAILLDFIFAEEDRTAPIKVLETWEQYTDTSAFADAVLAIQDPDSVLANLISQSGIAVTTFAATNTNNALTPAKKAGFSTIGEDPVNTLIKNKGVTKSLTMLETAASGNGSASIDQITDGVVRTVPLFINVQGKTYPSNIAEVIRVAQGASTYIIKSSTSGAKDFSANNVPSFVSTKIGNFEVPLTARGEIWLKSQDWSNIPRYSASDFLSGKVSSELITDKILIFGTSADGLAQTRATATSQSVPSSLIYAQAINQVLESDYLIRSDWFAGAEIFSAIAASLILLVIITNLSPLYGTIFALIFIIVAPLLNYIVFLKYTLLLDVAPLFIAILITYISHTYLQFSDNFAQKKQIRGAFEQYLSPSFIKQLTNNPSMLSLGGETRNITILFCDIRKFTTISEQFKDNPEDLIALLNRFLTPLTNVIMDSGGTIDKYMGDCIMAFWNAPIELENHAADACNAAAEMHKQLEVLNHTLANEGLMTLEMGIGINTGASVVGNMGSDKRFDYSVIGDAVNLAARLEGQSKVYGVETLISASTAAESNLNFLELDLIQVKGRNDPVSIYTPTEYFLNAELDRETLINMQSDFLRHYRNQDWEEAKSNLNRLRELSPKYLTCGKEFAERISAREKQAKISNWDGVYLAVSK